MKASNQSEKKWRSLIAKKVYFLSLIVKKITGKFLAIQWVNFFKGFICSSLNVLIYVIIAIFILGFAQGYVIPLDIYVHSDPFKLFYNLLAFHFLIYFLGLIMSLYPTYFYAFLFEKNKKKYYTSDRCGLMYYVVSGANQCKEVDDVSVSRDIQSLKFIESVVRKFLGILLFMVWSWLIVYVYNKHQIDVQSKRIVYVVVSVFTLFIFFSFIYLTFMVKRNVVNYKRFSAFAEKYYTCCLYGLLFALLLFYLVALNFGWHIYTVLFQLFICLLFALHLLIYRTFRAYVKPICNIVDYLAIHRMFGVFVLLFLISTNLSMGLAEYTNPINIVLANLIALYTVVIIVFKTYLFLKNKNAENEENFIPVLGFKIKLAGFSFILIGLLFALLVNLGTGSALHRLKLIDVQEQDRTGLEAFYVKFKSAHRDTVTAPILYAAYGGGLKAHYWNFMILDHLYKKDKFENILAMSGVSGGGMGIGNFTATKFLELSESERGEVMKKVKSSNILSIELSWFFGYDFIRECLPAGWVFGNDRSYRSMRYYTDILNASELLTTTSVYDVYSKLNQDSSYYPNIIINSTSTSDMYGVVSPVVNDTLFPGAFNLLDINYEGNRKTLTFFEAISTCNRFPLISPPANVPNKGHFVDGGYFENSGVMSLISFKNALSKLEKAKGEDENSIFNKKIKLISVRNEKRNYLQSLINNNQNSFNQIQNCKLIQNDDYIEISTIIDGIANLERMPNYIKSLLIEYRNDEYDVIDIDLPYYIDTREIEKMFGGKIDVETLDTIKRHVVDSNQEIIRILNQPKWKHYEFDHWGIVNPPTARILSKPVELYMEAMMEHKNVVAQLDKIMK